MYRHTVFVSFVVAVLAGCSSTPDSYSERFGDQQVSRLRIDYTGIARESFGQLQIIKPSDDPAERGKANAAERRRAFQEADRLNAVLSTGFKTQTTSTLKRYGLATPTADDPGHHLKVSISAAHIDAKQTPPKLTFITSAWLYDASDESVWELSAKLPPVPDDDKAREAMFNGFLTSLLERMRMDRVFK